ncbi:MBL fold metallo-hydrolase [Patescibacteria group bacterium]|nr:MBL fold metallo-hydrolase [Patescibacteria group bacterium]
MKLSFHGAARMVTGSNYLLEIGDKKILIDCGLFQGPRRIEEKNYEPFPYRVEDIDFVLITHAHLDHTGRLPKLFNDGFKGKVFATAPTVDFVGFMLEDSQKILHRKAVRKGLSFNWNGRQIQELMDRFEAVGYKEEVDLGNQIRFRFREAGHVLGSANIELETEGTKIVFSGDIGYPQAPIINDPAEIEDANYLIVESTYGDRIHEVRGNTRELLEEVIEKTINRNGVLLIPSFALERTQRLLYHFNDLVENKKIPSVPIFVDSPLAIKLTEIYRKYPEYYDQEAYDLFSSGDDIFNFPGLELTLTTKKSKEINEVAGPKIIIAGSGMSQGGRIIHHELRYLSDPKNMLLFVTYQVEGTLGRKIFEGAKNVKILGHNVEVNAEIARVDGYSSHADQKSLLKWVGGISKRSSQLKKVFVCHGEENPSQVLSDKITQDLGLNVIVPVLGQSIILTKNNKNSKLN